MRKPIAGIAWAFVLLCLSTACQADTEGTVYKDVMQKAQEVKITDVETDTVYAVYTTDEELDTFVEYLDIDHWEWEEEKIDETAEKSVKITFSQEATRKLGQKEADHTLHEVCTLTAYRDVPYITLKWYHFSISFHISEETQTYFNTFDQTSDGTE